jgi:hypothetical protein
VSARNALRCNIAINRSARLSARNKAECAAFDPRTFLVANQSISDMHEIIYLIGLVVVVMFILGLLGVR